MEVDGQKVHIPADETKLYRLSAVGTDVLGHAAQKAQYFITAL